MAIPVAVVSGDDVGDPVPVAIHSCGGSKRSLFEDIHAQGPDSVRCYTRGKTITQGCCMDASGCNRVGFCAV